MEGVVALVDRIKATTINSTDALRYQQNGALCTDNSSIDHWMLKHYFGNDIADRAMFFRLYAASASHRTKYEAEFREQLLNSWPKGFAAEADILLLPFYLDLIIGDHEETGHRVCCWYFPTRRHVLVLESRGAIEKATWAAIQATFSRIFGAGTRAELNQDINPQKVQKIRRDFNTSPYLISGKGTCAVWSRFFYLIGVQLRKKATPELVRLELVPWMKENVFSEENFTLEFQIFVANALNGADDTFQGRKKKVARFIDRTRPPERDSGILLRRIRDITGQKERPAVLSPFEIEPGIESLLENATHDAQEAPSVLLDLPGWSQFTTGNVKHPREYLPSLMHFVRYRLSQKRLALEREYLENIFDASTGAMDLASFREKQTAFEKLLSPVGETMRFIAEVRKIQDLIRGRIIPWYKTLFFALQAEIKSAEGETS